MSTVRNGAEVCTHGAKKIQELALGVLLILKTGQTCSELYNKLKGHCVVLEKKFKLTILMRLDYKLRYIYLSHN